MWIEGGLTVASDRIPNHLISGEVILDEGCAWAKDFGLEIGFRSDPSAALPMRIALEMRHCDFGDSEQTIMFSANGRTLGLIRSLDSGSEFKFEASLSSIKAGSSIRIQALVTGGHARLSVPVAFGIHAIHLT
jgi:hypothetical protein